MKRIATMLLAALLLAGALTGCGAKSGGEEAYVQSVSMICGMGSVGLAQRFGGVVAAQGETKVEKSANTKVAQVLVSVGDSVEKGQTLFTYDLSDKQLELERAQLELEQLQNTLSDKQAEKAQLESELQNAADEQVKLRYNLEIREAAAAIRETEASISAKSQSIRRLQADLSASSVAAPVTGRVQSINESGTDANGNAAPFMTIVETEGFRVKGYVNESNASQLTQGAAVLIRARVGQQTWRGTITSVDWNDPVQSGGSSGYMSSSDSDTATSSKYPFYVSLEDSSGLLLGQHVYIEPDLGQGDTTADMLDLPAYYISDTDSSPWVWAQSKSGKLEKRTLTLGEYNAELDTYPVLSGLTASDYIAFPDDTLRAGLPCVSYDDSTFEPEEDSAGGLTDTGALTGGKEVVG